MPFDPIEPLESRRLLTVTLTNGQLAITGTSKNDVISVFIGPDNSTQLDVKVKDFTTVYSLASVKSIFIHGNAGDDSITISEAYGNITLPVTVYGDGGDDIVTTASGPAHIF